VLHKNVYRKCEFSDPITWRAHNTTLSGNLHNFWVIACTWTEKPQAFHIRRTRTRTDTGFEEGENPFSSASNACFSNSGNSSAMNSSTNCLQLVGKTCRLRILRKRPLPATDQTAVHSSSRAAQLPGPLAEHPDPAVPAPSSLCPRCRHSAVAGEVGLWSQVSVLTSCECGVHVSLSDAL